MTRLLLRPGFASGTIFRIPKQWDVEVEELAVLEQTGERHRAAMETRGSVAQPAQYWVGPMNVRRSVLRASPCVRLSAPCKPNMISTKTSCRTSSMASMALLRTGSVAWGLPDQVRHSMAWSEFRMRSFIQRMRSNTRRISIFSC